MVNDSIIKAYLRRYSRVQIETALDAALANYASGVLVTSLSYEGGSGSGQITGKTEDLIEILEACLSALDESALSPQVPTRNVFTVTQFTT